MKRKSGVLIAVVGMLIVCLVAFVLFLKPSFRNIEIGTSASVVLERFGEPDLEGTFVKDESIVLNDPYISEVPLGIEYKLWGYEMNSKMAMMILIDGKVFRVYQTRNLLMDKPGK